ncbi:hypothetical protein A7K94_0206685 [Modestobacter sp. VKM Ac-2676]|nr:hypothetical protein A7K94_0206685 [Modestobacter sp. VKM Ac-2676]
MRKPARTTPSRSASSSESVTKTARATPPSPMAPTAVAVLPPLNQDGRGSSGVASNAADSYSLPFSRSRITNAMPKEMIVSRDRSTSVKKSEIPSARCRAKRAGAARRHRNTFHGVRTTIRTTQT